MKESGRDAPPNVQDAPQVPGDYSAFSRRQQNVIIGLAAFAGWFSSISSFIYFPAIPVLAADLGQSVENINLTVTAYLIVSGIFPAMMGDAADRFGRRPVFLVALTVYMGANIGLATQSTFGLLFFFRMLQSAGISGTYSVTYGVLGDLFTPAERGGYSGTISFFLNTPPSIGPIISGLLLLRWSWRSIFWFLSVATPCCLIPMALFFPETARNIVGDGRGAAKSFNRPLIKVLVPGGAMTDSTRDSSREKPIVKRKFPNPISSLKLMWFPGTAIILIAYGVNYSTYSCLQASLSTLFHDTYHITGVASGLIYIPFGVACAVSAYATGSLLDRNYHKTATEISVTIDKSKRDDLSAFPIEKARLRVITIFVAVGAALVMGYGWQIQERVNMAGPLVTQFFIGLTLQTLFTSLNTLLVDIHQDCPSTAQAACNFVRCELAAGYLAALDALIRSLGSGWCFVLLAVIEFMLVPMLLLLQWRGMQWRQARAARRLKPQGSDSDNQHEALRENV
ncbi:putative Major facilitator superfamily domain-containing protein [Seiridium unicorne]|uniref:Major facilitator superfamily domain-containing protein n=1 Tax=Seiridium unicorne TaxID=138068 RepID=A0ABR2UWQ7_9PEZI